MNLEDPKVGKHEFSSLLTIYYFSAMASSSPPSERKQIQTFTFYSLSSRIISSGSSEDLWVKISSCFQDCKGLKRDHPVEMCVFWLKTNLFFPKVIFVLFL